MYDVLGQPNFGVIEVNWDANPVSLRFEVRGISGEAVNSVTTSLAELQANNGGLKPQPHVKGRHCSLEADLPWLVRHRLAILFSFFVAGMFCHSLLNTTNMTFFRHLKVVMLVSF